MKFADRILTIVVTATLTSAAWIVFGESLLEMAGDPETETVSAAENPGGMEGASASASAETANASAPAGDTPNDTRSGNSQSTAQATAPGGLLIPVQGIAANALTNTYLDARGADGTRLHEAIDIMAPTGTSVLAAAPGTIAKLHRSGPGGNSIYIRSPDRLTIHYYAHLDQYASGLREGQSVRAGQALGTVGSTGNADPAAPHLHFAIMETTADAQWWEPANAINPYPLLIAAAK